MISMVTECSILVYIGITESNLMGIALIFNRIV